MRLQTSLQLSAVFPVVLPLTIILLLRWKFGFGSGSDALDITFMAVLALVGITMSAIIVSYNRRVLERMRLLNQWTDSVLAGNLDTKVAIPPGDDEISRLANALEKMLGDIKSSYSTLHQESLTYKQRAELNEQRASASQIGTKHLTEALARLKDSQTKTVNEERLKALEQVVRGVAHDVSEALTPIMATTDLLLTSPELADDKEKRTQHIQGIRQSAEQGREVIRHLAGFFHQIPVPQNNVDINHSLRDAIEQVESHWKTLPGNSARRVTLRTNMQIVPAVAGSEDDLREAFASIIANSFEAMPDGGTVTVVTRTAASNNVVIEINDTGKGMPEDVKLRAHEPFFSTKGASHKGMGLTRAAGTVRNHGGDIRIESEPGAGTRVTLSLPSRQVTPGTERVISGPAANPRQMKVIIVDDDKATREIIAFVASTNGHTVAVAASAAECLDQMKSAAFDVAIVDLAMPDMRGDELAAVIARTYPLTAIVMLTGFGDIMKEEKNIPENIDILVPKPVSAKELLSVLEKAPKAHWENRQKRLQSATTAVAEERTQPGKEQSFKWQG